MAYYITTTSFEYFISGQTSYTGNKSTKSFELSLAIHIVPEIDLLFILSGLSLKNRMKSHCDSNEYGMQPLTRQIDSIDYFSKNINLNKQLLSTVCNVKVIDENESVYCVLNDDLAHSIVHRWYRRNQKKMIIIMHTKGSTIRIVDKCERARG